MNHHEENMIVKKETYKNVDIMTLTQRWYYSETFSISSDDNHMLRRGAWGWEVRISIASMLLLDNGIGMNMRRMD